MPTVPATWAGWWWPTGSCATGNSASTPALTFAREAGYRHVTLWTTDNLVSARRIYERFGFVLADEEPQRAFGHDLVGRHWTLDLRDSLAA